MIRKEMQTPASASNSVEIQIERMFRHLKSLNPDPHASSQNFGKFVIKRTLSGGSQSAVLLAFDPDLRREVVIKVYSPGLSRDQKSMVLEEGRALSQIKSRHVASCLSVDTIEDCPYLVLEYVPGHPLDRLSLPLDSDTALEIVRQICLAVDAVHDRGILHLDLKPSNVMLADDGTVKLIDFGLAQPISDVSFGHVSGTPAFMAPEVAEHDVSLIDRRADIFGVGAIFYYLLTGQVLFEGETREEVIRAAKICKIRPLSEFAANVSPVARRICEKCLQKNPAGRYANIGELQATLPQSGRRRLLTGALATILVATLALLVGSYWPNSPAAPLKKHVDVLSRLMANQSDFTIAQDFGLTVQIQRADGSFLPLDKALEFDNAEKIQLSVTPKIESWIGVFSVEFDDEEPNLRRLVPISENEKFVFRVKGHETRTFGLELFPTPRGKEDYLVILARDELWVPQALKAEVLDVLDVSAGRSTAKYRGARGLSEVRKSAGAIIRYHVNRVGD
jgi:serine/threonine protein kinase